MNESGSGIERTFSCSFPWRVKLFFLSVSPHSFLAFLPCSFERLFWILLLKGIAKQVC